ncbi:MAG: acyl-CoA dehydrogenase family protein [Actinomycetota bacterium]|nr:acyl-CoA dehydrogenase family protein [Actinomycetota bacterium]
MNFELPPELHELQLTVRRMAQERVKPVARQLDEEEKYPEELFQLFAEHGLMGLALPEQYGGSGAGTLGLVLAIEEVAKYCQSSALLLLLSRLATGPILIAGTEEQKQRWVRGVAEGSLRGAFALSEPGAGSWVAGQTSRAEREGDSYRLQATKVWMSGATVADFYVVFAKTDPEAGHRGFSAFIVPRESPGVTVGRVDRKMGVKAVATAQVTFDGVSVPQSLRLGEEGSGFKTAMLSLNSMRPIVAARGIGLAEGALMYAVEYDRQRPAFGQTIADFQGIRWIYADLATEIEAARLLTYRGARLVDEGKFGKEHAPFLSMAKYYATELAVRASGWAVQLLGAAGYMTDHLTELYYRDARQLTIVEGTSQIQKNLIAQGVVDHDVWWD